MRRTKKNMKFRNKKKNYYKRFSNNRAYIDRRLPLLAKAGVIANRSSPDSLEYLPTTYDPKSYSSYDAWRAAVNEYQRDQLYTSISKAFDAGHAAGMHEATHPWETWEGLATVGTRSPTPSNKKKMEELTTGFKDFADSRRRQITSQRKARADAINKTKRSTLKTALLSAALGAAATHGAHLYMGANYQPQPPKPDMSFPSRMKQSLTDLTRMGRGQKKTRRRRKNRK